MAREDQRGGRVYLDMMTGCWQTVGMKTTTVRGIPDDVYDRVKQQAERDLRSINAQIVHILQCATETEESN